MENIIKARLDVDKTNQKILEALKNDDGKISLDFIEKQRKKFQETLVWKNGYLSHGWFKTW